MSKAAPRPSMSKARRLRLWERDKGVCYLCGLKVRQAEPWDIEHVIPWALAHDDSDENLKVAHKEGCHAEKTKADVGRIAKAKRQSGIEGGQAARRAKRGFGLISSRGFEKPAKPHKWPSRKFPKRLDPKA